MVPPGTSPIANGGPAASSRASRSVAPRRAVRRDFPLSMTGTRRDLAGSSSWRRVSWIEALAFHLRQSICVHWPRDANWAFFCLKYYCVGLIRKLSVTEDNELTALSILSMSSGPISDAETNPLRASGSSGSSSSVVSPGVQPLSGVIKPSVVHGHSRSSWVWQEVLGWIEKISRNCNSQSETQVKKPSHIRPSVWMNLTSRKSKMSAS